MPATTLTTPQLPDALDAISRALDTNAMCTIVGECTVSYEGRAESYLPLGERLVILKPDGTLLVHTDENHEPVNWQPPGCTHSTRLEDENDRLLVTSTRSSPTETVTIQFETIAQVSVLDLEDSSALALAGTEEDLRQQILDTPELVEDGFVPRAVERETAAGAIDIFGHDAEENLVAVELKRRRVGPEAVSQLGRYVDALDREMAVGTTIRGILVTPSVTDRAERLLATEDLEYHSLAPPDESSQRTTGTSLSDFED